MLECAIKPDRKFNRANVMIEKSTTIQNKDALKTDTPTSALVSDLTELVLQEEFCNEECRPEGLI